jgi:hypothetical protein
VKVKLLLDSEAVSPLPIFMVEKTHMNSWLFIFNLDSREALGKIADRMVASIKLILIYRLRLTSIVDCTHYHLAIFFIRTTVEVDTQSIESLCVACSCVVRKLINISNIENTSPAASPSCLNLIANR